MLAGRCENIQCDLFSQSQSYKYLKTKKNKIEKLTQMVKSYLKYLPTVKEHFRLRL